MRWQERYKIRKFMFWCSPEEMLVFQQRPINMQATIPSAILFLFIMISLQCLDLCLNGRVLDYELKLLQNYVIQRFSVRPGAGSSFRLYTDGLGRLYTESRVPLLSFPVQSGPKHWQSRIFDMTVDQAEKQYYHFLLTMKCWMVQTRLSVRHKTVIKAGLWELCSSLFLNGRIGRFDENAVNFVFDRMPPYRVTSFWKK